MAFVLVRNIWNMWRNIKIGNSLIAIVNKNSTGLMITTNVIHKISIQMDGALCSVKIFRRTSIIRLVQLICQRIMIEFHWIAAAAAVDYLMWLSTCAPNQFMPECQSDTLNLNNIAFEIASVLLTLCLLNCVIRC